MSSKELFQKIIKLQKGSPILAILSKVWLLVRCQFQLPSSRSHRICLFDKPQSRKIASAIQILTHMLIAKWL